MSKIKISVVIPMFNAEKSIISVLDSVYAQTWKGDLEIIIVNDGSTDQSKQLIQSYVLAHRCTNITLLDQKNSGVSRARNEGMKRSTGDWICLLDSDDAWLPHKLERQLEVIDKNPQIDFLGTTRNREICKRIGFRKLGLLNKISAKELLIKFVFVTPTIIFKRKLLNVVGYFDENQKFAEEGNYFIRIANEFNCYLLNESLVLTGAGKHHFGESGLSSNLWEMEKGELKNMKDSYNLRIINFLEYPFFVCFSILKYCRRCIVVASRSRRN